VPGSTRGFDAENKITTAWRDGKPETTPQYDALGRITQIDNDAANPTLVGQDYRFFYDNPSGGVTCPTGSPYACAYRRGRLGRVQIEYAAGLFYEMLYDYAQDGQTGVETYALIFAFVGGAEEFRARRVHHVRVVA